MRAYIPFFIQTRDQIKRNQLIGKICRIEFFARKHFIKKLNFLQSKFWLQQIFTYRKMIQIDPHSK